MSSKPVYERIIFNRLDQTVRGFTFETKEDQAYVENYVYKQGDGEQSGETLYDMFIYKNPGFKKMLRFKLHNWGVQTLESIIKKENEFKDKLKELQIKKEALLEKTDKIVTETKEKVSQKINEIKDLHNRK